MAMGAMRMSINEKQFIEAALRENQRIDGRTPFDFRRLVINFSKDDSAEVQLGGTRVLAVVSAQLVQPYPDRPNEGTFAIFTEFSPMADPGFEPGRPGEMAVELGRIIDRGLRESKAVDTESLCVLAGRSVWAIRLDIHILDNGGNLIDAANLAALAALLSFRRPECTLGGPDGQDIIVHPPEVREPLALSIHHLPIAVTFAFLGDGDLLVLDPSLKEELVMGGRLTITINTHGEVCGVQKGGGVGVSASELMRCLRLASTKAAVLTETLKKVVEVHETERAQRKIRRHHNFTALSHAGAIVDTGVTEREVEMDDAIENTTVTESKEDTVMLGTVKVLEEGEIRHEDGASNFKQNAEDDEQERVEVHKEEKPIVALFTEQNVEAMEEEGLRGDLGNLISVTAETLSGAATDPSQVTEVVPVDTPLNLLAAVKKKVKNRKKGAVVKD
ncbi:unnamed protein product [Sphagnum jensenii]|uniref:Exosome complex component RRP45 n=1 Tax=Sphagnum jensenii TaxID=128206 RepID=A0ABP1BPC5_9BRYO